MTNGEKIEEIFPNLEISPDPYSPSVDICVGGIMMMRVDRNWWNAEYKEPKMGYWIDKNKNSAFCSCCNKNNTLYGDFCKWCGAKMVEPQESEE